MKLHVIIGLLTGLVFGFWQHETIVGLALFTLAGLLAGHLAGKMTRGNELVYWVFLLATIILLTLAWFNIGIGRLLMALPLVFVLSYFMARIFWRFLGEGKDQQT